MHIAHMTELQAKLVEVGQKMTEVQAYIAEVRQKIKY